MKKYLILALFVFLSVGFINFANASGIPLTITAPTLTLSKQYDGLNTATVVATGTVSGLIAPDDSTVLVSAVATYDTAATGTGKTITVVYSLSGASSTNYIAPVNYSTSTGAITPKQLTITAPTLTLSKQYDGLDTATLIATGTVSGIYGSESVLVNGTATYTTVATGTGKTINVAYTITGANAGNYLAPINYSTSTGAITPKQLTIATPTITLSKIYNGNNIAAVVAGALSGKIGSEDVTINTAIATYDTIFAGTGKTINVAYTIRGANAGNYFAPINYSTSNGVIVPIKRPVSNNEEIPTPTDSSSATNVNNVTQVSNPIIEKVENGTNTLVVTNKVSSPIYVINRQLKSGIKGDDISTLQSFLARDMSVYPEGLITGYFGNLTKKAVQKFQEKYNIASKGKAGYGEVGPKTKAKLIELYGN